VVKVLQAGVNVGEFTENKSLSFSIRKLYSLNIAM